MIDFDLGQTRKDVGQIILRIDATAAATDQDGVNDGAAPTGIGMSDEEPSLAANGSGTD